MQRKLIGFNVFEEWTKKSLPATQYELIEAEDILSRILETGPLSFHNFNDSHVYYETETGTFVRANYQFGKDSIQFDNLEEIVLDEQSVNEARKNIVRNMVDAVLENNKAKADNLFDEVMDMVRDRLQRKASHERNAKVNEATGTFSRRKPRRGNKAGAGVFVRHGQADPARSRRAKEGHRKHPRAAFKSWETRKRKDPRGDRQKHDRKLYGRFRRLAASVVGRKHKKTMTEWCQLTENVFGYLDYVETGRTISEATVQTNNKGDVTSVKIPVSKVRNEGKILSFQLKTLKTDLKILRETARRLSSDRTFVEKVVELKRNNNLSDNAALEESLGEIVSDFPSVLYLTQEELAGIIGDSLSRAGVGNYDDRICSFMSEGILRVAHGAYNDRVARIHQLSGASVTETEDPYIYFQNVVTNFYPTLDESVALEMQVFVDLYNAAVEVRRLALESKNDELREEAEELAIGLKSIVEGDEIPSLEFAAVAAGWLENIVETNLEMGDWDVVKTPHVTVTGDHPRMAQNAKHPYTPASDFTGDWGSELPQLDSDGKGYKTFGNKSKNTSYVGLMDDGKNKWKDMYPDLENPYVPKAGEFTLHGEPGVDKNWDKGLDMYQTDDTFPSLENPYVPKSVKPHVHSDNRVDDVENRSKDLEVGTGSLEPRVKFGGSRVDGR
jgi:hypothetical protein